MRRTWVRRILYLLAVCLIVGVFTWAHLRPPRQRCDCPPPPGSTGGYACACDVDHASQRIEILAGVVLGAGLIIVAWVGLRPRRPFLR